MTVSKDKKKKIISNFWASAWDTWSAEVQAAILTAKIENLKEHLLAHKSDNHSRRWIMLMVAKRRKILAYIKRKDPKKYEDLISKLEIRK